ncbi:MAG: thiamine pyrophosphate-binding protein, partial [Oscillibacter sp.]|nr:thiamine pyrophosphate-binding protein [Oscillibacter sp.]
MKIRSTQAILECLLEQGVDTVFGYPGGTILNLYDELYHYRDRIRHVLTSHEQGASHAADGYARATGKVGVCFATSGPGATNLTTGIATAHLDSSPVVFITCNVSENLLGRDAFQEVDITGIAMPITKATFLVRDPAEIVPVMREAFVIAASGRPGPVLIDFLKNVTAPTQMVEYAPVPAILQGDRLPHIRALRRRLSAPQPDEDDISRLLELIQQSERPFLVCGGGVVRGRASAEFLTFAERLDAPVAITVMGGGGIAGDHPLVTGMIGMHGSHASNVACAECDLLIAVGCRFSDRVATDPGTFAAQAKVVQIDIDQSEIDKNILTDLHIVGDAKAVLFALNARMEQLEHGAWKDRILSLRPAEESAPSGGPLNPAQIMDIINRAAPETTIFSTDVGQHQMWAIQSVHFHYPGQLLTSGGFGTMGFGLGAAIGAQAGFPARRVLHLTGDGCFRMNCNELATV